MDKPLTLREVTEAMSRSMELVRNEMIKLQMLDKPFPKFKEEIENVSLESIIGTYAHMEGCDKRIYMPWELDGDCIVITYKPFPGLTMWIESEPVEKYVPNMGALCRN